MTLGEPPFYTALAAQLLNKQKQTSGNVFGRKIHSLELLKKIVDVLIPQNGSGTLHTANELEAKLTETKDLFLLLTKEFFPQEEAEKIIYEFMESLPSLYEILMLDAQATYNGDPAAVSVEEVIVTYPGFLAVTIHRIAHFFYQKKVPLLPRIFSEHAHGETGVDIHPGATIGNSFCIDHGTGVVIGETTEIKERVKIYQGVTLGALSVDKSLGAHKRHPTVEEDVVIYANATILGGNTIIGRGSVIGGNVWLTKSVAPGTKVYEISNIDSRKVED